MIKFGLALPVLLLLSIRSLMRHSRAGEHFVVVAFFNLEFLIEKYKHDF